MLQVQGVYDGFEDQFHCGAVYLVVPSFGPIPMISNVVFDLKNSKSVPVDLKDAAKGKFKIEYGSNNDHVIFKYNLRISFVGKGRHDIPIFPVFGNPSSHFKVYVAHQSR
jgi:hypothetical protein